MAKESVEPRYMSGFCMTQHHDNCNLTIEYYEKKWTCECACHETKEEPMAIYCPECDEPTTQASLDKYEKCYDCEKQACPECGLAVCDHNE